ncbi:response regulator transcription factor [Evansella sp. AB-rgal1]|uniref:response regulator transcription factor n=1 Tax=Evansella sp. AB-rgal1 TaxID=3242696 RepID=UPI00359EA94F
MMISSKTIKTHTKAKIIIYLDQQNYISSQIKNEVTHFFEEVHIKHNIPTVNKSGEDWIFYVLNDFSNQEYDKLRYHLQSLNVNESRILLVSVNKLDRNLFRFLSLQICGVVTLETLQNNTITVISSLLTKGVFLEPKFHYDLVMEIDRLNKRDKPLKKLVLNKEKVNEQLTKKEQDILQLLLDGHSNSKIAELLFFAQSTVSTTISVILKKIDASDRTDAIVKAIRIGWVDGFR